MEKLVKKINLYILLIFIFTSLPLQGLQAAVKVVNVDVEGLVRLNESQVRSYLTMTEGNIYREKKVNQDIKSLYRTGYFEDIKVRKEKISGGIKLIYQFKEKGFVRKIRFEGNDKYKDKELIDEILIRENEILDEQALAESAEAIRLLYEDKKYFLVEVNPEVLPYDTEKNELEIVFNIKENKKVRIKRISFVGNKAFSDKVLRKEMLTKIKSSVPLLGGGKLNDEKLNRDIQALSYFYLNHGYLKVNIGEPEVSLTRDKKNLYLNIPIHEGVQYKVGNIDIVGDILTTKEEIKDKLLLKTGDIYSREKQDQDIKNLINTYGDQAYAFANIYPDIRTNDETKEAYITYVIQKGYKVLIERIDIKGNVKTRDKVIRRELTLKENAPFRRKELEYSRQRLYQLGYFEEVNFSTPRGSRNDRVIVNIDVVEKSTGSFNIGAGFSSLESFIFNAGVQKDNLFGLGVRIGVAANFSKLRQEFSLTYMDRYFLDTRWITSISLNRFTSQLNNDFDRKSFGGTVSFGREVLPYFDLSAGYRIEDVEITNFSSRVPKFFQDNANGLTSSVIFSASLDKRDNRLNTSKGHYHLLTTEYAGEYLAGDNDFWKIRAESRYYLKLPLNLGFKVRGVFGYVNSLDDQPVPLFERFFLGGINTLRGFDPNSLGPKLRIPSSVTGDDKDFVFGGNRSLFANAELIIPIIKKTGLNFSGVVFFDAGQAFGENESISVSSFRSNYGVGFRWDSPFGPLRFEWGIPIDRRGNEASSVFNFSIGQSF